MAPIELNCALAQFIKTAFFFQAKMTHENVVSLVGVILDGNKLMIVTPFFEYGSLRDYILKVGTNLDPSILAKFSLDVAKGCEYVASLKVVHRDIAVSYAIESCQLAH